MSPRDTTTHRRAIPHTMTLATMFLTILLTAAASEADQLFSNGPLASVPGGGAAGMDASRLQSPLGMTSLGFNADFGGSSVVRAVADDFTVPSPGWNITRITVFAYQTDSGFTSTLSDLRLLIMNGPPNAPGSAVVFGNPAVNVLAFTSFTNVFRDSQASPGLSRRPIMSAVANVNVALPPGTYWLVWALAGRVSDGPFVPPITIAGQRTTGNGLQLCTCSGWGPALDTGTNTQQGFPFVLEGTVPGGTGPGASLSVTANATTFRPGDRFVLTATLTAGSALVDAYVVIDLPGGGVLSLTPRGLVAGVVPFARRFTPFSFGGVLFDVRLPTAPPGTYRVRAFLAVPGTTSPASSPSQFTFSVTP